MISLQNSLNVSKSKFKNKDIDILEGINKANNSVLKRACILKGIVKDRSIGPTSSCKNLSDEDYVDSSPTESFATSTPDQSLNGSFVDSNEFNDSKSETALPSAISNSSSTPKVENNSTPKLYTNGHSNHDNNFTQRKKLYNKKLKEFEDERKNLITVKVRQKVQLMMKEELKIQEEIEDMKHELQLARAQLEIERTQKLLREEEDIAYEAQQWKYVNEQRCNQRLNEANERIKKALQKQQEAEERQKQHLREKKLRLDKVHEYQILYRTAYQQLQEVIKTCKDNKNLFSILSNEAVKLKSTNERFEMLVENCKGGHVSQKDLENGEDIVKEIKEVLHLFKKEVDAVNLRHENAIKAEEEKLKIKSEQKIKPEVKPVPNSDTTDSNFSTNDLDDCVDKDSFDAYLMLKSFLASYEESLKPLLKDDTTKKFRFACQRAVNIPVNAISPYSREHMQDKYMRLFNLLKGESVDVSNSTVAASSHPLGIQFCTNLLAKKFVSQGEHTVSSKPEAAFAIAGIIVSLWTEFPDFGTLLVAHFQQECPYLIPAFMPQIEGQSNEDYYKILGYRYIDGKVESQDKFLKRMSGVMRLYAAIIVTQQHPRNVPHPLGLREGWRWLAASINLGPRTDITATLILDVLEVAGFELMNCYGVQFQKLLHLLCTDFFVLIEKVTPDGCGGPVRRLKTFLEKICKENKIMPPVGLLPKHIW